MCINRAKLDYLRCRLTPLNSKVIWGFQNAVLQWLLLLLPTAVQYCCNILMLHPCLKQIMSRRTVLQIADWDAWRGKCSVWIENCNTANVPKAAAATEMLPIGLNKPSTACIQDTSLPSGIEVQPLSAQLIACARLGGVRCISDDKQGMSASCETGACR